VKVGGGKRDKKSRATQHEKTKKKEEEARRAPRGGSWGSDTRCRLGVMNGHKIGMGGKKVENGGPLSVGLLA